jgi:oligoendopeptidase F
MIQGNPIGSLFFDSTILKYTIMHIEKPSRRFMPQQFNLSKWEDVAPYFNDLLERELNDTADLKQWMADRSELEAILEEDLAWRYIRVSRDTQNEEYTKAYTQFVQEIQPHMAPLDDQLNKKLLACPYLSELTGEDYRIYLRGVKKAVELFREENVPLQAEISTKSQEFGALSAAQTITHEGKEITMQQAATFLKNPDRSIREEVFTKIAKRRAQDSETLNTLFNSLFEKRHQVARNAGFDNFRDYMFAAMGRFDYTKADCFAFHQAIAEEIVPIVKSFQQEQADKLNLKKLRPWDTEVDPEGRAPLKPFETGAELLDGTIRMLAKLDPYFADCLATMQTLGHLDLESRPGKAPGGYNYPLYEIGVPFIFMNAVGSQRDLITMVHEGGHAVHSFLSRDLKLTGFKSLPSEVAELASMSMELLTMDFWNEFYSNEEELKRARIDQLKSVLQILPWIATVDEFQHRLYELPGHTNAQRTEIWNDLLTKYGTGMVDWSGFEDTRSTSWQRQLHIFEVPFYYIEYGMAQLGALSVWMNFRTHPEKALSQYKEALKLGYTRTIPDIYRTAGIEFDFSRSNIRKLAAFIKDELKNLKQAD